MKPIVLNKSSRESRVVQSLIETTRCVEALSLLLEQKHNPPHIRGGPFEKEKGAGEGESRRRGVFSLINVLSTIRGKKGFILSWVIGLSIFSSNVHSQTPSYPIGPGDILQVSTYAGGEKQEDFTAEVSHAGTMPSPLIGTIEVGGLTPFEVAAKMTERLARDFFVNPQVLVSVKEYGRKIYVLGEVKKPGAFSIQEGLTTLNACILAGGFTEYARLSRVKVTRMENGKQKLIEIDLFKVQEGKQEDLILQAGDRIYVPQQWF